MLDQKVIIKNLNAIFKRHTPEDYKGGVEFYQEANKACVALANKHGISLPQVVGIVSCLSPRLRWEFNIRAADWFLEGRRNVHVSTQIGKCEKILNTSDVEKILSIINGEKTKSFFQNIYNFTDENFVTVDRWILRIAYNENKISVSDKNYHIIKRSCIQAAKKAKLSPLQYQAVVWNVIRRENNKRLDTNKNGPSDSTKHNKKQDKAISVN